MNKPKSKIKPLRVQSTHNNGGKVSQKKAETACYQKILGNIHTCYHSEKQNTSHKKHSLSSLKEVLYLKDTVFWKTTIFRKEHK